MSAAVRDVCDNRVFVRCQYDGQYDSNVVFCKVTGRRVNHGVRSGWRFPVSISFIVIMIIIHSTEKGGVQTKESYLTRM